jgi:hypothetical protein
MVHWRSRSLGFSAAKKRSLNPARIGCTVGKMLYVALERTGRAYFVGNADSGIFN